MGIRLSTFAVDIPKFDEFLDASLAELMCRYLRDGTDPDERLILVTGINGDDTFLVTPRGSVRASITDESGRNATELTEQQIQALSALRCSARSHLSGGSVLQLEWVLRAFGRCEGIDFIRPLSNDQRRWWIGSLLQHASEAFQEEQYQQLTQLFRKFLRGLDCGHEIPCDDIGLNADGLPCTPDDDSDERFGRWTEEDVYVAVGLLSGKMSSSPVFSRPAGPIGIAPDDSEWHEWTHGNVVALLAVRELDYEECNVLSFIG